MFDRKQIKKKAKGLLKRHYWIFVMLCLIAGFFGTEFTDVTSLFESNTEMATDDADSDVVYNGKTTVGGTLSDVWDMFADGQVDKANELINQKKEESIKKNGDFIGAVQLGRTRGVFAQVVNAISSGSLIATLYSAIKSIVGSASVVSAIFVIISVAFLLFVWAFVFNIYKVVMRRIFLEGRVYDRLPASRFSFLLRVHKWAHVAFTMLLQSVYQTLWSLTIIGGIIKSYSYFMTPYIVAENPAIGSREAITLSRRMMDGHKWECFKINLSFIGWNILDFFSFGLVGLFFLNPYQVCTMSEYYAYLRELAKKNGIEGSDNLNDTFLFEPASDADISIAYMDVQTDLQNSVIAPPKSSFVERVFGLELHPGGDEQYRAYVEQKIKEHNYKRVLNKEVYPGRLNPCVEKDKTTRLEQSHYLRHYSVTSLILMFFLFSFFGWFWEVSLHMVTHGEFVNRGVLHGPWLPIYGCGGIMILVLLKEFRRKPALEFVTTVVLCGIVEYFTSVVLELMNDGKKWWDYSGYFLNVDGRICAEGLLLFGLGGMLIVYVVAPFIDDHFCKIPFRVMVPLCATLLVAFCGDQVYSKIYPNTGKGITACAPEEDVYFGALKACAPTPVCTVKISENDTQLQKEALC